MTWLTNSALMFAALLCVFLLLAGLAWAWMQVEAPLIRRFGASATMLIFVLSLMAVISLIGGAAITFGH